MPLGLFIAAASAVGSLVSGKKAKKAQKKANAAQRKINRLKNEQAKRAFLRKFRQQQAAALVSGVAAGVGIESSTVQGELSSGRSQRTTAVGEFGELDALGGAQEAAQNQAASANFQGSVFGAVGAFASSKAGGDFLDGLRLPGNN